MATEHSTFLCSAAAIAALAGIAARKHQLDSGRGQRHRAGLAGRARVATQAWGSRASRRLQPAATSCSR